MRTNGILLVCLLLAAAPEFMDGTSLRPLVEGRDVPWRDELFLEACSRCATIRSKKASAPSAGNTFACTMASCVSPSSTLTPSRRDL
jgi:hypothetical protein